MQIQERRQSARYQPEVIEVPVKKPQVKDRFKQPPIGAVSQTPHEKDRIAPKPEAFHNSARRTIPATTANTNLIASPVMESL
jgi:hypothetical protein